MVKFKEKRVWFEANGKKCCGILTVPFEEGKFPIVVLVHGFRSGKDADTYTSIASLLSSKGIASFRFDYYGHGESQGRIFDMTVTKAMKCLDSAIKYVNKLNFVDKERVGILGSSLGGIMSFFASIKYKIKCSVLFCPVSSYPEHYSDKEMNAQWKSEGYFKFYSVKRKADVKIGYGFYKDSQKYDSYKIVKKLKCPTLIVHGTKDVNVPIEQSKKLIKMIPRKTASKLEIIEGADHFFRPKLQRNKRNKLALEWILKYL